MDKTSEETKPLNKKGETVFFEGKTGELYRFVRHPYPFPNYYISWENLPDIGAVYIFTRAEKEQCVPLFIGQAHHLMSNNWFPPPNNNDWRDHYKKCWNCLRERLINSICVYFQDDLNTRLQIVSDLIVKHHPPCNNL